jgi:hypothetical protein
MKKYGTVFYRTIIVIIRNAGRKDKIGVPVAWPDAVNPNFRRLSLTPNTMFIYLV